MDFFARFQNQIKQYLFVTAALTTVLVTACLWLLRNVLTLEQLVLAAGGLFFLATLAVIGTTTHYVTSPVRALWHVVQFVSPHSRSNTSPDLKRLKVGREMITAMADQIYQFASIVDRVEKTTGKPQSHNLRTNFVANALPLPLVILGHKDSVVYANAAAGAYFGIPPDELCGQHLDTALPLSFSDEATLATWLKSSRKTSATADHTWERVRIGLPGETGTKLFDLAAHYNKSNPQGYETMLVFFDHSEQYGQDDKALSFVALTVHELRTPLTLLRGYIEVFDEEIGPTLDKDMQVFMHKMDAAAKQLTTFIGNILNVAKIEDDQLTLQLREEQWAEVLGRAVDDLQLRAQVRGITVKTDIEKDLPAVAVDRYSIYEVVANLLDNAIKYSGTSTQIFIEARKNSDGMVETSIKDFGRGIDSAILPHVFEKFYRSHRNRAQIGGTGLGLYLSKMIIQAHHGQISARSKPGLGSTFSFTVLPYKQLSDELKASENGTITRSAHGWIKNHNYYKS